MVAVVIVGFMINSFGLQGGLERVTKVMMIIPVSYTHLDVYKRQV